MKVYEINPENFGKYKHMLPGILKQPNMCGVFSQSCGHCQSMKPAWSKLKSKIAGTPGEGSLIELDSNVIPQIDHPLRQKISGYPTILIIRQGIPKMEYSGNRTFEDMYEYFKKHVSMPSVSTHSPSISLSSHTPPSSKEDKSEESEKSEEDNEDKSRKRKSRKRKKKNKKQKTAQSGGGKRKSRRMRRTRRRCCRSRRCCSKRARGSNCICGVRCLPNCPCCSKK